ncbi:fused MFS/spermidine synthase [Povalibacter sp.]|uniref:fused MFS/spermidine synthase n=1 Tax=Povalibacter sp. TaxID=1962978 RepID=UPI002F4251D1
MQIVLPYLIAGWSGFFVMAVELLGGRLMAPTFGSSIYVWGAIITVFMLALSIGYLAGGRYSMQQPSVRRLGALLIVAAVTVLPILLFGERMLDAVSIAVPDPRFGSLLAAAVLFFVPTVFSGMISPYAVRLLVQDQRSSGRHAGQLYFVSTFGSAAGTLLTSFYFVLILEVNQILVSLLAVSGAIGAAALIFGKRGSERDEVSR